MPGKATKAQLDAIADQLPEPKVMKALKVGEPIPCAWQGCPNDAVVRAYERNFCREHLDFINQRNNVTNVDELATAVMIGKPLPLE